MQVTAGSDVRLQCFDAKKALFWGQYGLSVTTMENARMDKGLSFSYQRMRLLELRKYFPRCSIVNLSWIAFGRSSETERGLTRPAGVGSVDCACFVGTLGEFSIAFGSRLIVN